MTLQNLRTTCKKARKELGANFEDDIREIYSLASDEVESGESEANEVSLALDALNELGYSD